MPALEPLKINGGPSKPTPKYVEIRVPDPKHRYLFVGDGKEKSGWEGRREGEARIESIEIQLDESGNIGGQLVEDILHILSYEKGRTAQDEGVSGFDG